MPASADETRQQADWLLGQETTQFRANALDRHTLFLIPLQYSASCWPSWPYACWSSASPGSEASGSPGPPLPHRPADLVAERPRQVPLPVR